MKITARPRRKTNGAKVSFATEPVMERISFWVEWNSIHRVSICQEENGRGTISLEPDGSIHRACRCLCSFPTHVPNGGDRLDLTRMPARAGLGGSRCGLRHGNLRPSAGRAEPESHRCGA